MSLTATGRWNAYTLHLGGHATAPQCARIALARNLSDWGLSDLLDDASVVVSELTTNAARLGKPFTLRLIPESQAVVIEVTDVSPKAPEIAGHFGDADAEAGRGLFIVDSLAKEWGIRPESHGKTVWARVGG
jgi:hypothetical protein